MKQAMATEVIRGAPAVAGTAVSITTLNHWVAIATGVYILVQVLYLLRKWWREESDWRGRPPEEREPR